MENTACWQWDWTSKCLLSVSNREFISDHFLFLFFLPVISGSVKIFGMNEARDSLVQVNHFSLKNIREYAQGQKTAFS